MHAISSCASRVSFVLFLLLFGPLIVAGHASADPLTLMWDVSMEPVAGYVVYNGTQSGSYSQRHDVGDTDTFTLTNAVPGQRYCFAVSAYSLPSTEGPKSEEVCGFSNESPTLANPGTQTSTVGQPVTLQLVGRDSDPVSYSASGLPPGLTLMEDAGFISGAGTMAGSYSVQASVSDGALSDTQAFTWVMSAPESPVDTLILAGRLIVRRGWTNIELTWSAVPGRRIEVYRDGVLIDTTRNDGSYTDRGSASAQYRVCVEEIGLCSNTISVSR